MLTPDAAERLVIGILHQAAEDLKRPDSGAEEFLSSPFFELICDTFRWNDIKLRNELLRRAKNANTRSLRAATHRGRGDHTPS